MMMVFLTAPAAALGAFLAVLCYRRAYYRHAVVLSAFAVCMALVTLGILGFGYIVWTEMSDEFVSV